MPLSSCLNDLYHSHFNVPMRWFLISHYSCLICHSDHPSWGRVRGTMVRGFKASRTQGFKGSRFMNAYSAIQYGMASQLVKSGLRIDNHAEISELDTQSLYSQIPGKRQAIKDSIHAFRVHLWFSLISCITHITDRYQDCA